MSQVAHTLVATREFASSFSELWIRSPKVCNAMDKIEKFLEADPYAGMLVSSKEIPNLYAIKDNAYVVMYMINDPDRTVRILAIREHSAE